MARRSADNSPGTKTPEPSSGRGPLVAGLAFSVAAHVGVIWLFTSGVGGSLAAAAFPPPPDPRITPGVDQSKAMNVVWLGFESPKEHQAPEARTEQAALSPEDRAAPPSPQEAESEPTEELSEEATEQESAEEAPSQTEPAEEIEQAQEQDQAPESRPEQAPVPDAGLTASPIPDAPLPEEPPVPEAKQAVALPGEASEADAAEEVARPDDLASAEPATSPRPQQAESSEAGSAGPSPERPDTGESTEQSRIDGARSDAESPPASTQRPTRITPGQVIAREGLQVSTRVPPRFSIPTELLASRTPVLVRIAFDARGDAVNVEVLRSSGHPGVDQEWVNALYRWKASGEALKKLDPDNPRSVHRMEFNVYR
ncbi:MAG: hypothetical protein EA423_02165 [Phycisphaerales bacterium]|nr:MAG: hypothetical protein EA423_02165 [Phycisphaerales bacterium]